MRRTPTLLVSTSIVTALLAGCGDDDQSTRSVEEAVHYSGEDRATYLKDCADDEGALEIYTTQNPVLADPLRDGFMKKYPGIDVTLTRRNAPDTAEAVSKEAAAGVDKVDVVDLKVEVVETLLDLFTDFDSPELEAYPPEAIGPEGKYVSSGMLPYVIVYNTDKVKPDEVPTTSKDLLDPRWKGKIAMSTTGPGSQWIGSMYAKYGESFIKDLGRQDIRVSAVISDAIAQQVASGEADIAPAIGLSGVTSLQADGAPVAWTAVDASRAEDTVEIAKKAPHPCAAMLYVDYVLSKEGQTMSPDVISWRTDTPPTGHLDGITTIGVWEIAGEHDAEVYQAELKTWRELTDRYLIN